MMPETWAIKAAALKNPHSGWFSDLPMAREGKLTRWSGGLKVYLDFIPEEQTIRDYQAGVGKPPL